MHFKTTLGALALALASTIFAPSAVAAAYDELSVGAGVSTLGGGLDLNARFSDHFSATLTYSGMSFDADQDEDDIRYQGDVKSDNATVKLNWHPSAGGFHLSGGVVVGDLRAAVTGTPLVDGEYEFNGEMYTAADVGQLRGKVELKKQVAPYLGLGYRSRGAGLGFFGEFGLISAKSEVQLTATGPISSDPQFQADLKAEEDELKDDVDFSVYPVLGLGMIYSF